MKVKTSERAVRDRLARPVIVAYWLLLGAGLAMYSVVVGGPASQVMWIAAIVGSVLGHALGLLDFRLWVVVVVLGALGYLGVFMSPVGFLPHTFWLTFVPATICAYASLADRWSLAAAWLPTVTWMLTVLDRTQSTRNLDGLAIVLLCGLAVAILVFLAVRESRRVGLWQATGATPLASTARPVVLTEQPGAVVGKLVWNVAALALAAAATSWIAPRLWQLEEFHHKNEIVAVRERAGGGLPCCQDCIARKTRVTEYLDLGRTHARDPIPGQDCRVCPASEFSNYYAAEDYRSHRRPIAPTYPVYGAASYPIYNAPGYEPGYGYGDRYGGVAGTLSTPSSPSSPSPSASVSGGYDSQEPAFDPRVAQAPVPAPTPTPAPSPRWTPPTPDPVAAPTPPPPPPTPVAPPSPSPSLSPSLPHPPPPSTDVAPSSPPPPPPSAPPTPSSLPHLLVLLLVGALSFRILSLALRPFRRAMLLRHLRSPLWPETVDQRVSNAWQLALIGLRDAGYRCDGSESPREFAHRVGIAGLDRCATILERTRYGVAIDTEDLADMQASSDTVYGEARTRAGAYARAASQLRWPLT